MDRITKIGGKLYGVKKDCCFICKHCTDIFYDIHGPYAVSCELDLDPDADNCNSFIEDSTRIVMGGNNG